MVDYKTPTLVGRVFLLADYNNDTYIDEIK